MPEQLEGRREAKVESLREKRKQLLDLRKLIRDLDDLGEHLREQTRGLKREIRIACDHRDENNRSLIRRSSSTGHRFCSLCHEPL